MKLRLLASALVLMGIAASAQTADELRIYINPGHGSWTSNDRPIQVIGHAAYTSEGTDTTAFFESNTNLYKGFGVLEKLIEMGFPFDRTLNQTGERWEIGAARDLAQNLVMSRVKNGPYGPSNTSSSENANKYNRSLLEICHEVEENEFDQFISIHSNAATLGSPVNYHLYLYRGRNGQNGVSVDGSWEMIEAANKYSFANEHAQWSESAAYIYGDIDFMGHGSGSTNDLGAYGYLGVLKHFCPGYLVEGYFHTYSPSTHRAMNFDVDIIEGYQYARGVAEYFELEERDATGEIYGIVRDAHKSFNHALWAARSGSDDVLMPINGITVILEQNGVELKRVVTDNYYNGAFVFLGLEPGKYTIRFESEAYDPGEPVEVEVTAGLTTYPKIYLTDAFYNGRPGEEMNYINPLPDDATLQESYDMTAAYTDVVIPQIADKTAKRLIWCKNKAYILALDAEGVATIVVVDPITGEVIREVSTEGLVHNPNGILDLSDIQVTGAGVLVAIGKSKNQYSDKYVDSGEERGSYSIYYWQNDAEGLPEGGPVQWYTTDASGEWYRCFVGDTFVFRGNMDEGELALSSVNKASTALMRCACYDIVDNEIIPGSVARPAKMAAADFNNEDFVFVLSPINRHQYFLAGDGAKFGMREYDFQHELSQPALNETPASLGMNTRSVAFFKYGADVAMTLAAPELKMYNISHGIASPTPIALTGVELQGEASRYLTTAYPIAYTDSEGNVTGGDFCIMVLRDNKLSRFASSEQAGVEAIRIDRGDEQPVQYYDLNGRAVSGTLTPGIYIRLQGTHADKVIIR